MNKSSSDSLVQIFRDLAAVLLALLLVGAGRWEIRDRYQFVADILVAVLALALVLLVLHLIFLLLERPARALGRQAAHWRRALTERRDFNKWAEKWRAYTLFILYGPNEEDVGSERSMQEDYQAFRTWLIENRTFLDPMAVGNVQDHLIRQWGGWNLTEYEKDFSDRDGFFPLYRHLEYDQQIKEMVQPKHHITHTFAGVWDGLSSYSVDRGWGSLEPLDISDHPTSRRFVAGLPPV